MKSFSVMEATKKSLAASGESAARRIDLHADEDTTGAFSADAHALLHWCRINERLVIDQALSDARVYAGFERLSRLSPVEARYGRMADVASEVWVIGENDRTPRLRRARTAFVTEGPLLREWFLLISSSRYNCLITARDLDGFETGRPVTDRRFEGLKTFSRATVRAVEEALREALGT